MAETNKTQRFYRVRHTSDGTWLGPYGWCRSHYSAATFVSLAGAMGAAERSEGREVVEYETREIGVVTPERTPR